MTPGNREDAVERFEPRFLRMAIELSRREPELRFVAFVAEADAPEAKELRQAKGEILAASDGSVAALVTRESAKGMLAGASPSLLDWLEDEGSGSNRKLPVIHAARRGMRTTTIEYVLPPDKPDE